MAFHPTWNAHFLRAIVPSFVADVVFPDRRPTWKLHTTSYLDGLRGLAAVIVCICHATEDNFPTLVASYGLNPDGSPSSWIQLPFLRIIFSGRPMVHIFFVISGFVLSYKPIMAIHANNLDKCFSALSSSTFRRPFRLFGPCVVSTFIIMVLIQAGLLYTPMSSLSEQFWLWTNAVFHSITWPWAWDFDLRPGYDIHLWTIPIEFAHSMLLFMVILMLARVRLIIRQASVFALMLYCLSCGKWAGFEFLGGLFLAEIHLLQLNAPKVWENSEAAGFAPPKSTIGSIARTVLYLSIIVMAVFVGGWPNFGAELTPGIRSLLASTPNPFVHMDDLAPQKFWFALSAFFVVWAVGDLDPIRRFLENSFSQYFGRISYAVYICHGPVLNGFQAYVVGNTYKSAVGEIGTPEYQPSLMPSGVKGMIGMETPTQRTIGWLISISILGPLVIWVADIFWRAVDIPMINLARKLETACLDDSCYPERPERGSRAQGYSAAA